MTSNNGRTDSKRKGKRVKKELRTFTAHTIDDLFEKFYHAKVAEGRAERTLHQYKENFRYFTYFLDYKGLSRNIDIITTDVIRNYVVFMKNEKIQFEDHNYKPNDCKQLGLSPSTINTRLKTLRVMFRFFVDEELIQSNPMKQVKDVNEPQEEITVLTVDELRRLLDTPNKRSYSDFRDYVIMNLLLDTFLRISEALSLTNNDIDFSTKVITVRATVAKSRKARIVPIKNTTANLLKDLIKENEEFETNYVFVTNYGEQMDRNHFRKRLKKYAEETGITKRVHPHLFRHTSATMFLEAGGDIRHLQMLLGHADLRMVMRYTHLSKQALINQHDKFSPLNAVIGKLNKGRKILR
ncbi:tyrosine-type recombinase/integrase [Bacillus paramycoides]|uniref:tyrosine-type recombinase/integrase n=1 Tax=Bacillus paramycoides TaxID=2026194 RepID=UPI002E237701|nr:tyrosine-type recombinase/integrase [Bacillus paramycoides]MED1092076.1 tyrosine-type recombinase/integrase [Bacillus paramycoides]